MGSKILQFFLENFDKGGAEPEKSFVPWKERKYNLNHKILNNTGHLRNSFRIEKTSSGGLIITNTADYASYVNDGTQDTPARPILYTSKEVEAMVEKELTQALGKLFAID